MEQINSAVRQWIGDDKCVGAVTLYSHHGEIAHFEAHGYLERERPAPMPLDAIFRIYSMTKPITSVALMMLVDRGQIGLHDDIAAILPAFAHLPVLVVAEGGAQTLVPSERPITAGHLLSHSAGFDYRVWETAVGGIYRQRGVWDVEKTLAETIEILAGCPLAYQPGTSWQYSVSPDVTAWLVEQISGKPFATFLQEELFQPLGMADTGYYVPPEKHGRFTTLYGAADWAQPEVTGRILGEQAQLGEQRRLATPAGSLEAAPHNIIRGSTGLVTTAHDYHRFCQMLLNQGTLDGVKLLRPETVALMTKNQLIGPAWQHFTINLQQPGQGFGYGFRILMDPKKARLVGSPGEFSWWGAANTSFWVDPLKQIIGIQLSQFMPANHFPLPDAFKTAVYQNLPGE